VEGGPQASNIVLSRKNSGSFLDLNFHALWFMLGNIRRSALEASTRVAESLVFDFPGFLRFAKVEISGKVPPSALRESMHGSVYEDNGIKYREYRALFYEDH
jgi:hypothetical protein